MYEFIKFFWIFMLGGVVGFLIETIWCMIRWRKLESRKGLIYGYFIPIYAVATLLISMVVEVFKIKKTHTIFIVTFFISGLVEYVSSLFQEKFTGTISWDYSEMKFNLRGRINLLYLLGFGTFGVLWCHCYPFLLKAISFFIKNKKLFLVITIVTLIFMIYNCFISLAATIRQKNRRRGIAARGKFENWLDNKYTDEYLKKVYANSIVVD